MSDLDGASSNAETQLGDETDDGRILSAESQVEQPESETSGPSSDNGGDDENQCDAVKSNKRWGWC